jgi:hypothetical protein
VTEAEIIARVTAHSQKLFDEMKACVLANVPAGSPPHLREAAIASWVISNLAALIVRAEITEAELLRIGE